MTIFRQYCFVVHYVTQANRALATRPACRSPTLFKVSSILKIEHFHVLFYDLFLTRKQVSLLGLDYPDNG